MKFTPTLAFKLDTVPDAAREMEELLSKARASDARVAQVAVGASYAGDADPYKSDEDEDDEA